MALKTLFVVSMLLLPVYFQTILGHEVKCENLDKDTCAFAVSSTGKRCVLEKSVRRSGIEAYTCRSSAVEAEKVTNIVESDECIKACGLDRKSLGISSDALLESRFTQKLCSVKCLTQCPNVVDLFFNLAAGEGVYLPKLCESQEGKPRRAMSEIRSSGTVMDTLGPIGPVRLGEMAPEPATSPDYTSYAPPLSPGYALLVPTPSPRYMPSALESTTSSDYTPYAPPLSPGYVFPVPAPSSGHMPSAPEPATSSDYTPYAPAFSPEYTPSVAAPSPGYVPSARAPSPY